MFAMDVTEAPDTCAFDALFKKSVPHILEKIFFTLDYESFKICKEVSNPWNELLTSESFKQMGKSVFQENIEEELHQASMDGNLKQLRSILSSGIVDINRIGGRYDGAPLHYSSWRGHKDVVQLLLDAGAEPNKEDKKGFTPLYPAAVVGHKDVVLLLLDRGADPKKGGGHGRGLNPLLGASCYGHKDVVQLLVDRGVDPNKEKEDGATSLHLAAQKGYKLVVQLLLDRGAEPDHANIHGWTPLHEASYEGHKEVIQLLLIRGADRNNLSVDGRTPLSLALIRGHADTVNILQG